MAKAKDERIAVVAGTRIFYAGDYFNPGAVVHMRPEEASDYVALRQARLATPEEAKSARA